MLDILTSHSYWYDLFRFSYLHDVLGEEENDEEGAAGESQG
jgi:hypothetical protein